MSSRKIEKEKSSVTVITMMKEVKAIANPKNNKTQGIIRLIVLVVLLVNQSLISFGYNPLPFSEEQIYEGLSSVALVVSAIYSWWRHNNITPEAEAAQVELERKKNRK